jgi:hypothetical protein
MKIIKGRKVGSKQDQNKLFRKKQNKVAPKCLVAPQNISLMVTENSHFPPAIIYERIIDGEEVRNSSVNCSPHLRITHNDIEGSNLSSSTSQLTQVNNS